MVAQGESDNKYGNVQAQVCMFPKKFLFPLIVVLCIAVTVYIFYPGYMDNDALDQFKQGVNGDFNDWHPPIMSWLWMQVNRVFSGALGMLLMHVTLYWCGLGALIHYSTKGLPGKSLYLLIGFYPPAFMLLSTIVKDVAMATSLIFGFSLILLSERKRSLLLFVPGIVFLGYGMFIRHNAILAVFPLILLSGFVLAKIYPVQIGKASSTKMSLILGIFLFGIVFTIGSFVDNLLTQKKTYPFQQIMLHDLAGMSIRLKTYLIPESMASSEQPSMKDLRRIYQRNSIKNLYWPDFTNIHYKILHDPAQVGELVNAWVKGVVDYPRAYLLQRSNVFASVINLQGGKNCAPYYYVDTVYKPRGHYESAAVYDYYSKNPTTNLVFTAVELLRNSIIYRNWVYIALSLVLFTVSLHIAVKSKTLENSFLSGALALSASGSLYGLAYFFVATACDFRMFYWNVISSLVACIFLINALRKKTKINHLI